jgi:hypothetical protein
MDPAHYPPGYADRPPDLNIQSGSENFKTPELVSPPKSDSFITPPSNIRIGSVPPVLHSDVSIGAMRQRLKALRNLAVEKSSKKVAKRRKSSDKKGGGSVATSSVAGSVIDSGDEYMDAGNLDELVNSEADMNVDKGDSVQTGPECADKSNDTNQSFKFSDVRFDENGCMFGGSGSAGGAGEKEGVFGNTIGGGTDDNNKHSEHPNVWKSGSSFADKIKMAAGEGEVKMEFIPPVKMPDGKKKVCFSAEEIKQGGSAFALQLYGYFVGTSMDYRVVNANLRRMWRTFDVKEITKTPSGFYLCKFKSEKGMRDVLEGGPWLVENVPFFLHQWEPGVWLEKVEPTKVPLWVCVHNVPIELWTGKGISKLMSCIGKPLLMDRMTMERCVNKSGRMGYARVLVEVTADEELPQNIDFEYEAVGNFPSRVGSLNVTFQWKPSVCSHCKVFGHSFKACKKREKTEDEIAELAQKVKKDAEKVNRKENDVDDDGFIKVQRGKAAGNKNAGRNNVEVNQQSKGDVFNRLNKGNQNKMKNKNAAIGKQQGNGEKVYKVVKDNRQDGKMKNKNVGGKNESVPVFNKFDKIGDSDVNLDDVWDEDNLIYKSEKYVIDQIFKSKVNPSAVVREAWTNAQRDYYALNCYNHGLDEWEEEEYMEVHSDDNGMGQSMKASGGQEQYQRNYVPPIPDVLRC